MQEDPSRGLQPAHGHPAGHTAGHPVCVRHRQGRQTAGHYHHQREQQLRRGAGPSIFWAFPSPITNLDVELPIFTRNKHLMKV